MSEVVLSFAFRALHNGLGGVYVEAAFAGASGLVALGVKTVARLREGTHETADVYGLAVDARSANATVQRDDGGPALADGPTTSPEPVQVSVGDPTRRLTIQHPLPTPQPSLPYASINDTELDTNKLYAQQDPIDLTSGNKNLNHNFTVAAESVDGNDFSISASSTNSTDASPLSYATSLPPHITVTSICLIAPLLFVLAAVAVRSIWRCLYLTSTRRNISKPGRPAGASSSVLVRAVALHRPAALPVEAHTFPLPRSACDTAIRTATAANEEGDADEGEDAFHGDSDEDIGGAGAQGGDIDAPVGEDGLQHDILDESVAVTQDVEVGKARISQEDTELLGMPLSTPRVPPNILPRSKLTNDADADDDATEPRLPVLARIKAWEQGRRAAAREDDVQAGAETAKRGGGLLTSPVLMDDVDDEELPPAPVVERIKAWEQAGTAVRRSSGRKSAGRADDVRTGAEIAKGGEDKQDAHAPTGNDSDGVRSPVLDDDGADADVDRADGQSPTIETGMRSVASLKRLYEPFRFRLADSAFAADQDVQGIR